MAAYQDTACCSVAPPELCRPSPTSPRGDFDIHVRFLTVVKPVTVPVLPVMALPSTAYLNFCFIGDVARRRPYRLFQNEKKDCLNKYVRASSLSGGC